MKINRYYTPKETLEPRLTAHSEAKPQSIIPFVGAAKTSLLANIFAPGIKMIVTDLDGTLLREDKTISDYTASVFQRCRDKGVVLAFATARSDRSASRFIAQIQPELFMGYGGALVSAGDRVICRFDIPKEVSNTLIAECENASEIFAVYAINEKTALTNDRAFTLLKDYSHYKYDDFKCPPGQSFLKISVRSHDQCFVEALASRYPMCDILRYSGETLYRFANRDAVKGKAVRSAMEHLGISVAETVAFGDDYNDIEMLYGCGIGIAVANAIDEVKNVADYICDTNDNDGVAKWLEQNIL